MKEKHELIKRLLLEEKILLRLICTNLQLKLERSHIVYNVMRV